MKAKTKGNLFAIGGFALLGTGLAVSLFGNIAPKSNVLMGIGITLVAIAGATLFVADKHFNRRGATPVKKKHRILFN